jgi:peptidoglycan/LPS O-acetylase OafA/YrhL
VPFTPDEAGHEHPTMSVPNAAVPLEVHSQPQATAPSSRRLAPLDGIRAFAVLAVLLYHGGVSWATGGLLGVDVFFVLSGFLITSLLCREYLRNGTIALKSFWVRRARRLLPALLVLLLGVAVYAYIAAGSIDLSTLRGDALSTLLYVANWRFTLSNQGYFAQAAAPSPLLHMWSLGVEEQYYLVWPLIALFVFHRWGSRGLAWTAGVGAVASSMLTVVLYHSGASIDRLYYGTDTRAQALLVGSFLGAISATRTWQVLPAQWAKGRVAPVGRIGGLIGAAYLLWAWHVYDGQASFLYNGGFLVVAVATGAVITTVTTWPASVLARVCSFSVLIFIGRISYGLYLYHWPLFLVIDRAHTGLVGAPLLLVRLVVTFAAATVSFRFIEEPIRTRQFFRRPHGVMVAGGVAVITVMALLVATVVPATATVSVDAGVAMPPAERQQLTAANAFTSNPVRFEIFGDSLAETLSTGLGQGSKKSFGVYEYKAGVAGCDLDPDLQLMVAGQPQQPVPVCLNWPQRLTAVIDQVRPDVVGILVGRMETLDHLYNGQWTHVGDPGWDAHLAGDLNEAIRVSSSTGAKVVLLTMPYVNPPQEAANGQSYPENQPSRVDGFNAIVRMVAKEHPGLVSVIDLNRIIDPGGHYAPTVDGVTVRFTDGVHVSATGGRWLQPRLLPAIARIGLSSTARRYAGEHR